MMTRRSRSCESSQYRDGCDSPDHRFVAYSLAYAPTHNPNAPHRVHHSIRRVFLNAAAACALVSILIGCGSSTSDPAPGLDSRAAVTPGPDVGAQGAGQASNAGASLRGGSAEKDGSGQHYRLASDQPEQSAGKPDGGAPSPALNIPETIAKDLGSPNPSTRYRALDYWQTKETQAPLDPVFEAIEDEDPAVRTKATAIIEQYWAAEQERERG
jgi:hypothetical protein